MSKKNELALPASAAIDEADRLQRLEHLMEKAHKNVDASLSENTRRMYLSQWNSFVAWCSAMGMPVMPPEDSVVLIYLTHLADQGRAPSTLKQAYAAIREHYRQRDVEPPQLDGKLYRSWTGALKTSSQSHEESKAKPLLGQDLKKLLPYIKGSNVARDKAMLVVGWCGALRRSEIVALNVGDIKIEEKGLRIKIRKSKTDQYGIGTELGLARVVGKPYCPVACWERYLAELGDVGGDHPAFVSRTGIRLQGQDVNRILIRRMKQANMDISEFSGHSLRAGCITTAAKAGHDLAEIQKQSRHKNLGVLAGYIRTANLLEDNITQGLL